MEKVTGYITKDNNFFTSEYDAIDHERSLDFKNWYKKLEKKPLKVSGDVLLKFLKEHKEEVLSLFGEDTTTKFNLK